MTAKTMLVTKLFKKCIIYANNPIFREFFLVYKRKGLYCINIKNKSIRKVNTNVFMYDADIKYSSDGKYFVIVNNKETFHVFDANNLELINIFHIAQTIDAPAKDVYDIDLTILEDFVVYNEYLICNIGYMREPYRRYDEGPEFICSGIEIYNIITGNLVKNIFNISINNLNITQNYVYCQIENRPNVLYQLTPQFELTELSNNITRKDRVCFFNKNFIKFSIVKNNDEYFLYLSLNTRTQIDLNFKLSSDSRISNILYTSDNKYLLVVLKMYDITRVLFFNANNKYLFYIDIDIEQKNNFYILDDYRIVYNYKSIIRAIETPISKVLYAIKACSPKSKYFLPIELWNKVLSSF